MDSDDLRSILSGSRVGIFDLIETAIRVATSDYADELPRRRDKIVEALFAPSKQLCRNCENNTDGYNHIVGNGGSRKKNNGFNRSENDDDDDSGKSRNVDEDFGKIALTPESNDRNHSGGGNEEDDKDPFAGLFDDEQTEIIINIKEQLEDPQQSEEAVVELLQNLADMDITFQALKETDIGRHVNKLRKHTSNEVRRLVKQLVRKWKETVDQWVKVNSNLPQENANLIADEDSPQQNIPKNQQNGHHQIPDFGYSPNPPRNRESSAEKHITEHERKLIRQTPQSASRKETSSRPPQSVPRAASASPSNRAQRDPLIDDERLNSARRRLQENYQEAENAKKQRTVQMMDIREIPKPKNTFFKNRGGFHGRNHR